MCLKQVQGTLRAKFWADYLFLEFNRDYREQTRFCLSYLNALLVGESQKDLQV